MSLRVEYVGFTVSAAARQYVLRVTVANGDAHDFTLAIPNEAFLGRRVRYQDGPEVCFLKLQRQLADCTSGLPASHLGVTDDDLEQYRLAHTPKPPQRRPRPPVAT